MTWTLRFFVVSMLTLVLTCTAFVGMGCDRGAHGVAASNSVAAIDGDWVDMDDWALESLDVLQQSNDVTGQMCLAPPIDRDPAQAADDLDKDLMTFADAGAVELPRHFAWGSHPLQLPAPRPHPDSLLRPPQA